MDRNKIIKLMADLSWCKGYVSMDEKLKTVEDKLGEIIKDLEEDL